ncbi:fungal specific transcription factor [Hirsutella rhossiliensis]|uniref:Fungal specific transcription factor domain-containing protein n=1 Tax=Hirsutella rhossiliensis TaxID=111463 RepID=A0A9P8N0Q6_9HYPO|nr:fungal specific transcription factor domain-containing protein [Hirsutella rhossiliensis]KAH0964765.1 fungal specific transcription factor domain-containing protein [Hirsutella rhossiliensis]
MIRVMPIIRSRSGCFTCRRRKKKCNEEKPLCSGCRRNKLDCRWPAESSSSSIARQSRDRTCSPSPSLAHASPTDPGRRPPLDKVPSVVVTLSGPSDQRHRHSLPSPPKPQAMEPATEPTARDESLKPRPDPLPAALYRSLVTDIGSESSVGAAVDVSDDSQGSPSVSPLPMPSASALAATSTCSNDPCQLEYDNKAPDQLSDGQVRALCQQVGNSLRPLVAAPMALLPSHGPNSYELLSYYLSRTANSMGNGSTDVNPFIVKLVPLAFSNPLVLQLLLAQSAAHRQASSLQAGNEIAQQYYTDSLRLFRNVVGEYVSGKDENPLTLTVGSLILCLTEVARGDVYGTIFDHLAASRSLLTTLLDRPESQAFVGDLADFLVEYYMHTAASSIISTDPHGNWQPLLSPSIERMARVLVARKYMGQLCGCWLELLLLIPQVFQLGKTMLPCIDSKPPPPSADDIITFGFLQSQILAFFPPPSASPYSQLAGLVFKQAALLYLWSILGPPPQSSPCGAHADLVQGAVAEAVSILGQFPASARVNTSLCWPLAVIGCCTADPGVRDVLRARLETMIDSIGLGNMRETLVLLERIWRQPAEATSPWLLHMAMQEHRIWISFA